MRKLALFAFAFSAAIFLSQYFLPQRICLCCAAIGTAAGAVLLPLHKKWSFMLRISAFGLAAGFAWSAAYSVIFIVPAEKFDGYSGEIQAVVSDYPQRTDYGEKVEIRLNMSGKTKVSAMLYMYGDKTAMLSPGDTISLDAKMQLASRKMDNDYFASRGIQLFAYARSQPAVTGSAAHAAIRYFPVRAAQKIKDKITEIFPDFASPFATAILTGDRSELKQDSYFTSLLSTTGVAHIVAVSGMHVAFLVALLGLLLGKNRKLMIICIPVIFAFMAITGFSPSVVRAGIMQIILIGSLFFRREYDAITALSLALMILLAENPVSIKNGGLQLSFAATLGLILFSGRVYAILNKPFSKGGRFKKIYDKKVPGKIIRFIAATISSSFGALVFTVPLMAVMFGYVSVIAPLTNILILWAASAVFSVGVISVAAGFICLPIGQIIAWLPAVLIKYIYIMVKLMSKVPFASVYTSSFYIRIWIVFLYAEFIVIYFLHGARGRWWLFIVSNGVVLGCCAALTVVESSFGSLNSAVLDVGQGQCVVLTSFGKTAVVDCGGSGTKNAGDTAAEYLSQIGENEVDDLILTHFHSDHANGVIELMKRVKVDTLIIPELEETGADDNSELRDYIIEYAGETGTNIITVEDSGEKYTLGEAIYTVIPPLGGKNINEMGLSVLCTSGKFDMLITGDMSYDTEYRLIEYMELPDTEVLIAGHHGSKNSTSQKLIDAATPENIIISVGENSYGHPSEETIERVEESGANVYRTDEEGTILIRLGRGNGD